MKRIVGMIVGLSFIAGCTDPTAVQKFAQSAPPAASYHILLLNYANIPAEAAGLYRLEAKPDPALIAGEMAETARRCGQLLPLDNLHAAMIGYMSALGALATAGSASFSTSGPATLTPASTQAAAPATPTGAGFCAVSLPKPAAAGAGGSAAQKATADSLSADLTAFATANKQLKISPAVAGAAGSLAQIAVDVVTAGVREAAMAKALKNGHDAFLAAIAVETAVIQNGLDTNGNTDSLQIYNSELTEHLGLVLAASQGPNQAAAVRQTAALTVALANGTLLTPGQAANLGSAAQAYLSALDNLKKAYTALTAASDAGTVFKASTWNEIQPWLSDATTAYTAVNKL
ncbi:MAG TPA: hypothetical protein VGM42_02525 [Rhodopila sp.]